MAKPGSEAASQPMRRQGGEPCSRSIAADRAAAVVHAETWQLLVWGDVGLFAGRTRTAGQEGTWGRSAVPPPAWAAFKGSVVG